MTTLTTTNLNITLTAKSVEVADDRGEVQGWEVTVAPKWRAPGGVNDIVGDIIPPEGTSRDCWMGNSFDILTSHPDWEEFCEALYDYTS